MLKRIRQLRDYSDRCRSDPARQGTALLLAVLIVFVGIFDIVSTDASLAAGNAEANALIAAFQQGWGTSWFMPKILIHLALAVVILWLPSRRMIRHARIGIAIYAVIIASNFHLADWQY